MRRLRRTDRSRLAVESLDAAPRLRSRSAHLRGVLLASIGALLFALSCTATAAPPAPTATPLCEPPCRQIVVRLGPDRYEPPVTCAMPGRLRILIENQATESQDVTLSGPGLFLRLPSIAPGRSHTWETTMSGGSYVVGERQPRPGLQPRSAILILKLDCSAPL